MALFRRSRESNAPALYVSVFRFVFSIVISQTLWAFSFRRSIVEGSCPTKRRASKDPTALIRLTHSVLSLIVPVESCEIFSEIIVSEI